MEYNSKREHLIIPEYGRNVQKMIAHACTLADRDERNRCAQAIIGVMGQLNPSLRDIADFNHKLWAHLFIISDFKLDVDSPYPKPDPAKLTERPKRVGYPQKNIQFKHYGHVIELLIEKAKTVENPEERQAFIDALANLMKKSYLSWNRDSVNDNVIENHLELLSGGALKVRDGFVFENTADLVARNNAPSANNGAGGKRKKRSNKHFKPKRKF